MITSFFDPKYIGSGICEIELSNKMVAVISEGDADTVSRYRWYASTSGNSRTQYAKARVTNPKVATAMHRLILCFPLLQVDHVNRNGLDNRRENLRFASQRQNSINAVKRLSWKSSRYLGVHFSKATKKWVAQIRDFGRLRTIGSFESEVDAAKAWDAEAIKWRGEFAILNFPE